MYFAIRDGPSPGAAVTYLPSGEGLGRGARGSAPHRRSTPTTARPDPGGAGSAPEPGVVEEHVGGRPVQHGAHYLRLLVGEHVERVGEEDHDGFLERLHLDLRVEA